MKTNTDCANAHLIDGYSNLVMTNRVGTPTPTVYVPLPSPGQIPGGGGTPPSPTPIPSPVPNIPPTPAPTPTPAPPAKPVDKGTAFTLIKDYEFSWTPMLPPFKGIAGIFKSGKTVMGTLNADGSVTTGVDGSYVPSGMIGKSTITIPAEYFSATKSEPIPTPDPSGGGGSPQPDVPKSDVAIGAIKTEDKTNLYIALGVAVVGGIVIYFAAPKMKINKWVGAVVGAGAFGTTSYFIAPKLFKKA